MVYPHAEHAVHAEIGPGQGGHFRIVHEKAHRFGASFHGEHVLHGGGFLFAIGPAKDGVMPGPGVNGGRFRSLASLDNEFSPVAKQEICVLDGVPHQVLSADKDTEGFQAACRIEQVDFHFNAVLAGRFHIRSPVDRCRAGGHMPSGRHRNEHFQIILGCFWIIEPDLPPLRAHKVLLGLRREGNGEKQDGACK